MTYSTKNNVVRTFLNESILVSSDFILDLKEGEEIDNIITLIKKKPDTKNMLVLNKDSANILKNRSKDVNWLDLEKYCVLSQKKKNKDLYCKFITYFKTTTPIEKPEQTGPVRVLFSYDKEPHKRSVEDFVAYFNNRYSVLEKILRSRPLANVMSIARVLQKKDRETVSIIGIVKEKALTKNQNLFVTLEDPTGEIRCMFSKNKRDLFASAKNLVLDEVVAMTGFNDKKIIFSNELFFPDVPARTQKKSPDEVYAIFLSDMHVGSTNFMQESFNKFLKWLNKELGSEKQKEIIDKTKYLFVLGDLVDGVGVYPNQEEELAIKDIYAQYDECANLLSKIPKHINVIICPGNHDALRISEPQPVLDREFAEKIHSLPNITLVSNPALVNIHSSESFPGFDVLLYHGFCFDYYVSEVDEIRIKGGYDRADLIMKFLLQKRHLAPSHTSTLYIPDRHIDPLVISHVPDIFATGHIHKCAVSSYRNVLLICGSCWQSKTSFQEKSGHHPEPGRVPVVNLKTREVKIFKF